MSWPDWRTSTAGTRIRVALWLAAEVGPGGHFTKQELREGFPGVEQVDRRMRDLRPEGWVIHTNREDASLGPDELCLVEIGGRVWERGYESRQTNGLSDKQRRAVLAADNYLCVFCGIGAGEPYADDPLRTAKLTVVRRTSGEGTQYVTSCDRCQSGRPSQPADEADLASITRIIDRLDAESRRTLFEWIARDAKKPTPVDVAWSGYRRLSAEERAAVRHQLSAGS